MPGWGGGVRVHALSGCAIRSSTQLGAQLNLPACLLGCASCVHGASSSARWSADEARIEAYLANGRRMQDSVYTADFEEACTDLPADELQSPDRWPYA